jgi:hypothetical protein
MSLGAFRLKKAVLVVIVLVLISVGFISCGYSSAYLYKPPSGLTKRVLASQGVSSTQLFGSLWMIDGRYDTIARTTPLSAGGSPGLMAISPTRNVLAAFDTSSNSVFGINAVTEASLGRVQLPGPTSSMVVPTASQIGYAAVPTATVTGYSFLGAVDVMDLSAGSITTTIGVTSAKTVVANATGSQLLVFSDDSDSVTVLSPSSAVPPVDTSCFTNPPNAVCAIVPGFSRPVNAIVNGSVAYVLNCGLQCGANPTTNSTVCGATKAACISVLDLGSLTVTSTIPVDAATMAFLSGSTLYVAGTSPINNGCTGQTTAATTCGTLEVVNLGSGTVTTSYVITDGYHSRMDMSTNGQLFIGSHDCTNIGNVNDPSGEVRGCLSILNTNDGSVVIPPDNGNVNGLQGFSQRDVEYVAEGGALRVYDTTKNILLINDQLPEGTINVVGYVGDVKAIDFF